MTSWMKSILPGLCLALCLAGACDSGSPQTDLPPDAGGAGDLGAEVSPQGPAEVPQAGCADLPAAAACRLSGTYELTYDQVAVESTADSTGFSCQQVTPLPRVVFTASAGRLCAGVDDLVISPNGCTVELTSRFRTDAASEHWTNETRLRLTFAAQDGGTLEGTGTARLQISGFHICTKTANVTARSP